MDSIINNFRSNVNTNYGNFGQTISNLKENVMLGHTKSQIMVGVVIAILLMLLIKLILKIQERVDNYDKGSPVLVEYTKNANRQLVIKQLEGRATKNLIRRSQNEQGGIEFSYQYWMYIDNWDYKTGVWKHVFHKGNDDSWPNRAPGVWIHPDKNALRVYMNTYKKIDEYLDIPNIPIQKWVHVAIVCKNRNLYVYINGQLRKSLVLTSIPKQNYGDLYINSFGGFDGFISLFKYHDFALPVVDIKKSVDNGPSSGPCPSLPEKPPYLATNWWQFPYF